MDNNTFELKIDKAYLYYSPILVINSIEFEPDSSITKMKYTKLDIDNFVEGVMMDPETKTYSYKIKSNTTG
jgi:hypothetical protein